MFSSVQISVSVEHKNCQTNYSSDEDFYVFSGETGIFLQNSLTYRVFSQDWHHFKYITDSLPINKDILVQYPNSNVYAGTEGSIIIHSANNPMSAVLYRELNQVENYIKIDLDNKSLITGSGESYPSVVVNRKIPITFQNQRLQRNSLTFATDCLFQTDFDARYEKLLYPFSLTEFSFLYLLFEHLNWDSLDVTLDYISDDVSIDKEFEILKPKYLFGDIDGNWWVWDAVNTQWVQRSPSGDYFEFAEFRSIANTYTEYLKIPKAEFISKFGLGDTPEVDDKDKVKVLTNNYYFTPKLVSNNYWINQYDSDQYLYIINKNSKVTFIIGSI